MRDPLKECIDEHRAELDKAVPSNQLWAKIETAMIVAIPAAGVTSGISWLKYFAFGLSSVAGAAIVYTALSSASPQVETDKGSPAQTQVIVANDPQETPTAQEAPAEFTFVNTAVPLPPSNEIQETVAFSEPAQDDSVPAMQPVARANAAMVAGTSDSVFTGIKRVEVIATTVSITVQGINGNELSTMRKDTDPNDHLQLEYKRNDTLLQVFARVENKGRTLNRKNKCISISRGTTSAPELLLNVPAGVSVVVQNTYGDTKVSNVSGPLCEVRSSSGDVRLASITASTNVVTSYGDLDARDITGNFSARLSSGSVVVKQVKGNVEIVCTYGDQLLSDISGNLKANASSGHIRVTNLRGDINANTTYGDIQVTDFKGSARLISSSGSITGEKVELTASSSFSTTYGDVTMTLLNPLQALSFELNTTYGDILVDKNGEQFRDSKKLNLTRGAIVIKATSSSGSQVFR